MRVQYPNQTPTCRRCNSPDHLARDCNNEVCFNCDSTGHVARSCPDGVRCCICKELGHKALDCQRSWSFRPLSERDSSIAASVDNEGSVSSYDEYDRRSDAGSESSVSTVRDAGHPRDRALSSQGLVLEESAGPPDPPPPDVEVTSLSGDDDSEFGSEDDIESNGEEHMESNNSSCDLFTPSEEIQQPSRKRPRQQQETSELGGKQAFSVPLEDPAVEDPLIDGDRNAPT